MDHDQQLRNLRDFLLVYNRMTEICFQRCSSNFNYRNLTMDEEQCVDSCAGKLIRSNHRLMSTYVQLMPRMVQRRMEEMESKAAENAKAAEAAATSGAVDTATLNASPAFETPITSLQPPQLPPSVTEVAPEIHDSVLKSAGLAIPPDTTATEVKLSAATPLTPKTESLNIPVLNEAGPLHTAGFPESGVQIDFGSPKPASSPENVLIAATSASVSEGMASQDRPSEVPPPSSQ
ncbi:mitochondrial import inner membrane translocase subunit Tim10 B [Melanotaenia boesemani]|uniref:mitochondrial import inner membrane translocase subunit Tim10 B n=1 Tax=Melanotaenia boesemani TaxID=1250792 RepID=UPI001C03AE15|nr:mitochondrial import inner membrane translocase subunit Tim10 B [Melanotaenia boesemani]XP_041863779.1 mitochondrial import inner membrane translocase subunit Tim10 B [Melanotaenia boesemani]XP_041863780.1 mitochondrial import inner membrane translocase subunit Tim10 B [Melanotaenia boesemani]